MREQDARGEQLVARIPGEIRRRDMGGDRLVRSIRRAAASASSVSAVTVFAIDAVLNTVSALIGTPGACSP